MFGVVFKNAFFLTQACMPSLLKSDNPHVLFMLPPLDSAAIERDEAFTTSPFMPYTIAKFRAGVIVKALALEFKGSVAVNSLWPRTLIASNIVGTINNADNA